MLTKAQTRTAVQNLLDDNSAKFWTASNLDILIGLVYDELWGTIVNTAPYFVSQLDSPVFTSPGYINVASGGALSQRFHRLQSVVRNERTYSQTDQRDVLIKANAVIVAPDYHFTFYNDQLWLFPLSTTADAEIRYSFKPAAFSGLADGTAISWPDGYEGALIFESAARASSKGERMNGDLYASIASRATNEMLLTVKRRQHFMGVPWTPSTPVESGGI